MENKKMKLIPKYKVGKIYDCYCELTTTLDELAGITSGSWRHYIVANDHTKKNKVLAIRIPGGTVGSITYDDNQVITDIVIDTKYVVKTYAANVNEIIKENYLGVQMEN